MGMEKHMGAGGWLGQGSNKWALLCYFKQHYFAAPLYYMGLLHKCLIFLGLLNKCMTYIWMSTHMNVLFYNVCSYVLVYSEIEMKEEWLHIGMHKNGITSY